MNSPREPARLAGHADNAIEPANALLVLELTPDAGQRLTRPAAAPDFAPSVDEPQRAADTAGLTAARVPRARAQAP